MANSQELTSPETTAIGRTRSFEDLMEMFNRKDDYSAYGNRTNATISLEHELNETYENTGSNLQTVSGYTKAVFITLYTSIAFMSLLGNSLVCLVVVRNKRMRSVTNFFLANQALSDVFMTVLNIPFIAYSQMAGNWPFGELMCHLADYMGMMSVHVSSFMLTAIALDRHRFIVYPHRPRITKRTAMTIAILIWAAAMSLSIPYATYRQVEKQHTNPFEEICLIAEESQNFKKYLALATFMHQFMIPLSLISAAYFHMGMRLRSRARRTARVGDANAHQQRANNRAKQRTTFKLVLVVAVFTVCWCPLNIYILIINFSQPLKSSVLYLCLHCFAMCSVCINPLAFAFINKNFRNGLKTTFRCGSRNIEVQQ